MRRDFLFQILTIITTCFEKIDVAWLSLNGIMFGTKDRDNDYKIHKNRIIEDLDEEWARTNTRFAKNELQLLLLHLHIPEYFIQEHRETHKLLGEIVLLISLVYMAHGTPFYNLVDLFGGNPREFGIYFNIFSSHLYDVFFHRISGDSLSLYTGRILIYIVMQYGNVWYLLHS